MSLEGTLKTLSTDVDRIEQQYYQANMSSFLEYTKIMVQIGPIFKQAEVFQHLLDGHSAKDYPDEKFVKKELPFILFPTTEQLTASRKLVSDFCMRALALSDKISAHGHQFVTEEDKTLQTHLTLQLLAMYLKEMETASAEDEIPNSDKKIVTDFLRKVEASKLQPDETTKKSRKKQLNAHI